MTKLRAHFDGQVLVPEQPLDLPIGVPLDIDVHDADEAMLGSAAHVMRAVRSEPHLAAEDVAEMLRGIDAAMSPAQDDDPFKDLDGEHI